MVQETQTILPNGTWIQDRYIVESLLGKGGFGAVYLIRDQRVEQNRFALKEISEPDARTRKNFLIECALLQRLDHPALPRFYRVFENTQKSRIYLLMDYVAGQNLETLRQHQPKKRFSLSDALRLMGPVIDAVSYFHHCEPPIIHRDIKPANIIVSKLKEETVLVDFGIAKEYDQDGTTTAVRRLSPHYSAPEQYTIGTNLRTDIYGLAATLYVMLSGVVPVDALQRMVQLRSKGLDPLEPLITHVPSLAPEVSAVIERALSIHAEDRFASVQEFWLALQTAASPEVMAIPSTFLPSPEPATAQSFSEQPTFPTSMRDVAATTTTILNPHPLIPDKGAIPDSQKQTSRTHSSGPRRFLFFLLGSLALLACLALIIPYLFSSKVSGVPDSSRHQLHQPTPSGQVAAPTTHAVMTPAPTTHVVMTPTPSATTEAVPPKATVEQAPGNTPSPFVLGSTYAGSIDDQSANITGTLTLTQVQQQGTRVKGMLLLSNGLSGQAAFTGTLTTGKTLQFIVTPYPQYLPLLFEGKVDGNGSLSGTYCSEQNNQCAYSSGGYGTWQAAPVSPQNTGS